MRTGSSLQVSRAMVGSLVLENRHADDAVVMDAVVLRAADSAGAPAALAEPLPRGVEVTILERRDSWTRVSLPGGTSGWLPDGAVEPVVVHVDQEFHASAAFVGP
jgi:hypothetical protein